MPQLPCRRVVLPYGPPCNWHLSTDCLRFSPVAAEVKSTPTLAIRTTDCSHRCRNCRSCVPVRPVVDISRRLVGVFPHTRHFCTRRTELGTTRAKARALHSSARSRLPRAPLACGIGSSSPSSWCPRSLPRVAALSFSPRQPSDADDHSRRYPFTSIVETECHLAHCRRILTCIGLERFVCNFGCANQGMYDEICEREWEFLHFEMEVCTYLSKCSRETEFLNRPFLVRKRNCGNDQ